MLWPAFTTFFICKPEVLSDIFLIFEAGSGAGPRWPAAGSRRIVCRTGMYTDIQVSRRLKPFFRHEPMTRDLFSRYVWIIDTLTRYGRLSRERLGSLWLRSSISNGQPLPERTFFHYRRSIEQNFHIDINCDESGQYYIDQASLSRNRSLTNLCLLYTSDAADD